MSTESIDFIKELAGNRPAGGLTPRRSEALSVVEKKGLPGRHLEDWKYTDGKAFLADKTGFATGNDVDSVAQLQKNCLPEVGDCFKLVLLNGIYLPSSSSDSLEGVLEITALEDAGMDQAARPGKIEQLADNVFANLNLACGESGIHIRVPAGVVVPKPVLVVSCISRSAEGQMLFPRVLVELGESAALECIEVSIAEDSVGYSSFSVVEAYTADNANLSYIQVNRHSHQASVFNAVASELGRNSTVKSGVFNFGGATTRNEVYSSLKGENGRSEILALNVLQDRQHVDNHTVLDHAVPHCESFELVKGVYGDASKGVFDGTIIVRPDAQKTNAIQSNQSLLLSDRANSHAKPQLKIWADDVKCTHGATVGQLDDHALFYLRSRGISETNARAMLIHAFASEVISEMKVEFLKNSLEVLLTEKLAHI